MYLRHSAWEQMHLDREHRATPHLDKSAGEVEEEICRDMNAHVDSQKMILSICIREKWPEEKEIARRSRSEVSRSLHR